MKHSYQSLRLYLCAALLLLPYASATSQRQTQEEAEKLNRSASDSSLQNSSTNAMKALMDLSALNIQGAINNGYKAYGQYRTSEDLDDTSDRSKFNQLKMESVGSSSALNMQVTRTTYKRLGSSYLYKGEAASVAAEFEKKSGMKREEFLSHLSSISENKISPKDPQLVNKVVSRFESFVSKIPNKGFRANLEKGINMIPESARTGMIAKAVNRFANYLAGGTEEIDSSIISSASQGGEGSHSKEASGEEIQAKAEATSNLTTTSDSAASNGSPTEMFERGLASSDKTLLSGTAPSGEAPEGSLGNIVQSALQAGNEPLEDESIFQQISRCYRRITPSIVEMGVKGI